MQSFQTEIDAMLAAQRDLARHREILEQQRATAAELRTSVPKSTSGVHDPVADKLHEVFAQRAEQHGGVQGVLDDYLKELENVQILINDTLNAYATAERDAIARYGEGAR